MIFDWKNNRQIAAENGICEEKISGVTRIVMKASDKTAAHHTFRNFEKLEFEEGTLVEDCVFEDCGDIMFDESEINGCTFRRINTIFSVQSNFANSHFSELVCSSDMVISLDGSEISHCRFENAELRENSYLCSGTGDSWIEHCTFSDIRSDREDRSIIVCEDAEKIFKRKKSSRIVDEDTCTGLDSVAGPDRA